VNEIDRAVYILTGMTFAMVVAFIIGLWLV